MPRFEIRGKGRETGRSRKRTFKAENEEQARALAEAEGFLIESVTQLADAPPSARAAAATKTRARPAAKKTAAKTAVGKKPAAKQAEARPSPKETPPPPAAETAAGQTATPAGAGSSAGPAAGPPPVRPPAQQALAPERPEPQPSPPAPAPAPGQEENPPWSGLRFGRSGCLPVVIGGIGIGVLVLLL